MYDRSSHLIFILQEIVLLAKVDFQQMKYKLFLHSLSHL